ncbi:hypothetical protein D9M71_508740 [compost metagenome]
MLVTGFLALAQDVLHLLRGEELGFLDVDHRVGLGHRHDQIGLPREEGRQLDDVADLGHRGGLERLVDVGDDRHVEGLLDLLEDLQSFFHAGTTERRDRRAVGLVEAGLEHVGDAELLGDPHVFLADLHCQIARLQYVHTAEQHERQIVADLDVADADDLLRHDQAFPAAFSAALTKPLNSG